MTAAADYADEPGTEPGPQEAADAPAASFFDPDPGPAGPDPAPAASVFARDPGLTATAASTVTEEPPPAAAGDWPGEESPGWPGEESPAQGGDPASGYQPEPAGYEPEPTAAYESQPAAGYAAGYDPGYVPAYPAETGYNHGMTPPVGEEAAAPAPAYPADLPGSPEKSGGAKSAFTGAYRSLPRPKARGRAKGQVAPARRANLVIARLEPWSVMKFSFLMSLVAWVVLFVAVALLYYALSSLGVFESIQRTLASVTSSTSSGGVNLTKWTSASRVLGYTMLAGAVDVVLITALATIGAMVYNLVTHLGGGIEVTLKETD